MAQELTELMSSNIKPKAVVYGFQPGMGLSMVAEESVPYVYFTQAEPTDL